jgi:hypothetical protein
MYITKPITAAPNKSDISKNKISSKLLYGFFIAYDFVGKYANIINGIFGYAVQFLRGANEVNITYAYLRFGGYQ